jgi:predicted RNase H-like HicB family nuclease
MRYTVLLTEKMNGTIHVRVPGLPECVLDAPTRDEALEKARHTIAQIMSHTEFVQLDVPMEPTSKDIHFDTPWEMFGAFEGSPTWGSLFDEIESQRG